MAATATATGRSPCVTQRVGSSLRCMIRRDGEQGLPICVIPLRADVRLCP